MQHGSLSRFPVPLTGCNIGANPNNLDLEYGEQALLKNSYTNPFEVVSDCFCVWVTAAKRSLPDGPFLRVCDLRPCIVAAGLFEQLQR